MDEAPLAGTTVAGRYRLLEVIGEGGMGRVFRAEQVATGRPVALKLLNPELSTNDEVLQRFKREANVTARLSHRHIVKAIEFGEADGHLFLAMELVAGRSLAQLIDEGDRSSGRGLGVARAVAIMRAVLDALVYAHARGVVHRDLKPANVMVMPRRGIFSPESVKVLDFGVAKLGDDTHAPTHKLTQVGRLLGTPSYMSPEQALGQPADARSDVYSCGVMLYEMLTGQRPFVADQPVQVLSMQLNATPRSLRAVAPAAGVPLALEAVVLRALAKRPEDRFQSAAELRRAVLRAARPRGEPTASELEATVLAAPKDARAGSWWMRLAIIGLSAAMLVGDHRQLRNAPAGARRIASSDGATPNAKARQPPASTRPALTHERARREQTRHAPKETSSRRDRSAPGRQ